MKRISMSLAMVVALLTATAIWAQDSQPEPDHFQKSFQLHQEGALEVINPRGNITIDGWEKDEVDVEVTKHFEGSARDRELWLQNTHVRFNSDPTRLTIIVETPQDVHWGWWPPQTMPSIDLVLHVPKKVNADLKDDRGRLTITSITGNMHIESDRSPITVRRFAGAVRLHSDRGDVRFEDVDIRAPSRFEMDRGNLVLESNTVADTSISLDRGEARLRLPRNAKFNVEVERSRRTSYRNDFEMTTSNRDEGHIYGTVNGGGPTVHVRQDRGLVAIEKL